MGASPTASISVREEVARRNRRFPRWRPPRGGIGSELEAEEEGFGSGGGRERERDRDAEEGDGEGERGGG
jgi:hypothetical protein